MYLRRMCVCCVSLQGNTTFPGRRDHQGNLVIQATEDLQANLVSMDPKVNDANDFGNPRKINHLVRLKAEVQ